MSISGGKLSVSSSCSNFGLGVWGEGRSQSLRNIRDAQVLLNYVRQPCQNCQKVVPSVLKRKSVSSRNRPRAQRNVNTTCFISVKSPCTLVWVLGRTFFTVLWFFDVVSPSTSQHLNDLRKQGARRKRKSLARATVIKDWLACQAATRSPC